MRSLSSLFVLGCALAIDSPAQTLTTIHNFDFSSGDWPNTALVQGTDGNFYGTTENGGAYGFGTIYKITSTGTFFTLVGFGDNNGEDPSGGLVLAIDGSFYGTTSEGGSTDNGTVFRITPEGALTILHTFSGTDGRPNTTLVQAIDRNLYGTTYGNSTPGAIFKLDPGGGVTNLKVFPGNQPTGLIQALDGNFYGTTYPVLSAGEIFKITADGALTKVYTFCAEPGCPDGNDPLSLFQAATGRLYGECYSGGATGDGTVFEFNPATGILTTIYNFNYGGNGRGEYNPNSLIPATDGNLYGTTFNGGPLGGGTIFTINSAGVFTVLHAFQGPDGWQPNGLLQATDGDFYGTTFMGGANDEGTAFRISMGLSPFVKTLPTAGHVGAAVQILGTDLTAASSVTFNGTPAAFAVVSATEISATVPAGATTGKVQVTTLDGALLSNVPYRVFP